MAQLFLPRKIVKFPLSVVLDSSVLFGLSKEDWRFLEKNTKARKIQIWDSVVGLCELICHVHKQDGRQEHNEKWVSNKCANLIRIAPNQMLPSPGLVVTRALREWLKWPQEKLIQESQVFLRIRKDLASNPDFAKSDKIKDAIVTQTLIVSKNFQISLEDLSKELNADYVKKAQSSVPHQRFKEYSIGYIQRQPEHQSNLFCHLMYHHQAGSAEKVAVALQWRNIPYIRDLISIYNLQIGNFVARGRKAAFEDFIDFEWAAYIASNHIHHFVTNNKRDFQEALKSFGKLSDKVLDWEDFKKKIEN